jgi:HEAT repeat protein
VRKVGAPLLLAFLLVAPALAGEVEDAVEALHGPEAGKRVRAAHRLGELDQGSALGPLLDALADPYEPVRSEAAWAIGTIGSRAAPARAFELLKPVAKNTFDPRHPGAIRALGELGSPAAFALLEDLTWSEQREVARLAMSTFDEFASRPQIAARRARKSRPLPEEIPAPVQAALDALVLYTTSHRSDDGEKAKKMVAEVLPDAAPHFLAAARSDPRNARTFLEPLRSGRAALETLVLGCAPGERPEVIQAAANALAGATYAAQDRDTLAFVAEAIGARSFAEPRACGALVILIVQARYEAGYPAILTLLANTERPALERASAANAVRTLGLARSARDGLLSLLSTPEPRARSEAAQTLTTRDFQEDTTVLTALVAALEKETDANARRSEEVALALALDVESSRRDLLELARACLTKGGATATFEADLARARLAKPPVEGASCIAPPGWLAWQGPSGKRLFIGAVTKARMPLLRPRGDSLEATGSELSPMARLGRFVAEGEGTLEWLAPDASGGVVLGTHDLARGGNAHKLDVSTRAATASPSGVLVARVSGRKMSLVLVPFSGSERVLLERNAAPRALALSASSDGERVAVTADGVWVVETTTAKAARVLFEASDDFVLAPDGRHLLALASGPSLLVASTSLGAIASVESQSVEVLTRMGELVPIQERVAWLRGSRAFAILRSQELGVGDLSGSSVSIALEGGPFHSLSPVDERHVVITGTTGSWLLDLEGALAKLAAKSRPPLAEKFPDQSSPEAAVRTWRRAACEGDVALWPSLHDGRVELPPELTPEEHVRLLREFGWTHAGWSTSVEVSGETAEATLSCGSLRQRVKLVLKDGRWLVTAEK